VECKGIRNRTRLRIQNTEEKERLIKKTWGCESMAIKLGKIPPPKKKIGKFQ